MVEQETILRRKAHTRINDKTVSPTITQQQSRQQ